MKSIFEKCKKIADSSWFQASIIAAILVAGVVVGIQTYERTSERVQGMHDILVALDLFVLIIFTIEVIIKLLAEGKKPWKYFTDPWNIFDFSIVAVCYLAFFIPSIDAGFVAVLRLARILRVFKLVTAVPQLQMLVGAMLKSVPSMGYVGILLGLLFYIYAAMAVFMFGENDPLHFGTLHKSMLSLFRVVTLEDWTDIMYVNMYGCDHSIWGYTLEEGCINPKGNKLLAAFFFVSFVLIGTMIVLNLFIGVIMNSMDEVRAEEEEKKSLELRAQNGTSLSDEISDLSKKLSEIQQELSNIERRLK